MGMVYADSERINGFDLLKAEAGELPKARCRRMTARMLVEQRLRRTRDQREHSQPVGASDARVADDADGR